MKKSKQINVRIGEESLAKLTGENNKDKIDIWRIIPDREERERRLSVYLKSESKMYKKNPRMIGKSTQVNIRVTPRQKDEVAYLAKTYKSKISDVIWIIAKEGQYTQEQYDTYIGKGKRKGKRR